MGAKRFKKILVPIDFSEASIPAYKTAMEIAKLNRSILTLLHVLEPFSNFYNYKAILTVINKKRIREIIIEKLKLFARKNCETKNVAITYKILSGIPCEKIIEAAQEESSQLIVMGTHETPFKELSFGSTAQRVLTLSEIPVLTMREKGCIHVLKNTLVSDNNFSSLGAIVLSPN